MTGVIWCTKLWWGLWFNVAYGKVIGMWLAASKEKCLEFRSRWLNEGWCKALLLQAGQLAKFHVLAKCLMYQCTLSFMLINACEIYDWLYVWDAWFWHEVWLVKGKGWQENAKQESHGYGMVWSKMEILVCKAIWDFMSYVWI